MVSENKLIRKIFSHGIIVETTKTTKLFCMFEDLLKTGKWGYTLSSYAPKI